MELLKMSELKLNSAGYLVAAKTGKPVNHENFVKEQEKAHFTVLLAEKVKNANFKKNEVTTLDALKRQLFEELTATPKVVYVEQPKAPKNTLNQQLQEEGKAFEKFVEEKEASEEVNAEMQQYNTIKAVEEVGDYFSEGLVRVAKLYSTGEVLAAVKAIQSKL